VPNLAPQPSKCRFSSEISKGNLLGWTDQTSEEIKLSADVTLSALVKKQEKQKNTKRLNSENKQKQEGGDKYAQEGPLIVSHQEPPLKNQRDTMTSEKIGSQKFGLEKTLTSHSQGDKKKWEFKNSIWTQTYHTEAKKDIGGLLLLPAIGLILSPLLYIISIFRQYWFLLDYVVSSDFGMVTSRYMLSPDFGRVTSRQYPGINLLIGFELFGTIVFFVFVCFVAYSFFRKRYTAPQNVILYLWAQLSINIIHFFIAGFCILRENDYIVIIIFFIILSGLVCAIWIPYFKMSKRVKETFVY
jgi:hypothetical protein